MALKEEGLHRKKISKILSIIGTFCDRTVHRYTSRFMNGDEAAIFEENRGKYHRVTLYEMLPDFAEEIKQYQSKCQLKRSNLKKYTKSTLKTEKYVKI